MKPTKIDIMGESFLLYSLADSSQREKSGEKNTVTEVFLLPSLKYDFKIEAFNGASPVSDISAAAVCAAAHLTQRRGLPLSEFIFETTDGNIEVLCTGKGHLSVKCKKCKQLCTNSVSLAGCDIQYTDISVGCLIRLLRASDVENFDKRLLSRLSSACSPMPAAVLSYSASGGGLNLFSYTQHSVSPPSVISLYCAAAYNEYILSGGRKNLFSLAECGEATVFGTSVAVDCVPKILE